MRTASILYFRFLMRKIDVTRGSTSWWVKVKVKFTLKQATKAQRGSKGTALLFHHGARWGWVVNATHRPLPPPPPRKRADTHFTGGWLGPRAVLDGYGKSPPPRDSIPGPSNP
jgi:hypothetical protein